MSTRPLVGLALGGGVVRGMAHIGVLKALKRAGIPVHMVAGTSSGGIVAALLAAGNSPERIEEIALSLRARDMFDYGATLVNLMLMSGKVIADFLGLPFPFRRPLGLMKGNKLEAWVNRLVGRERLFGETVMPLGITAVDVRNGQLVVFVEKKPTTRTVLPPGDAFIKGQPVALAVRASTAVPGIFEPVRLGDRLLVDGGVRDNVPAYVLRKMGADFVIAVDVGYDGHLQHNTGNITDVLIQSFEIVMSESINTKLEHYADVVIRPEIKMSPWDFSRAGYCIGRGELAASKALEEIKSKFAKVRST